METSRENLWHYTDGNGTFGPLTSSVIRQLIAAGVIHSNIKIRREGEADWISWSGVDLDAQPQPKVSLPPPPPAPPAAIGSISYHLTKNGQQSGPFSETEIREMLMRQEIKDTDHVWKEGMSDWVSIGSVLSLLPNGSSPPPPTSATAQGHRNAVEIYFSDVLKNQFADFKGRASRKQFWIFYLFYLIIAFCIGFIEGLLGLSGLMSTVYTLAMIVPSVAIGVRRMQDSNHNGWWLFCPVVGLVFSLTKGTQGPNRYGQPPLL